MSFSSSSISILFRIALNLYAPQSVFVFRIGLIQVQDLALGFIDFHKSLLGLCLQPVQSPQDGIPSLQHVDFTSQLVVVCRLTEGALNPLPTLLTKMLSSAGPKNSHHNNVIILGSVCERVAMILNEK